MTQTIDPCDTMRNNLIAAAVGLQECTKTDGTEVLIPGTGKRILVGNDAYLAKVAASSASLASQSQAAQPAYDLTKEKVIEMAFAAGLGHSAQHPDHYPAYSLFAEIVGRAAIAAHIAGTSQATKAQAEPVAKFWYDANAQVKYQHLIDDAYQADILVSTHKLGNYTAPLYAAPVAKEAPAALSDEAIDEVWGAMPGGPDGWLKQFGYRQFARSIARHVLVRVAASMAGTIRPTDDELWEQTIGERDHYHDMADKLAEAIAKHFNAEIGEHSNMNCPWAEALEVIERAPTTSTVSAPAQVLDALRPFAELAELFDAENRGSNMPGEDADPVMQWPRLHKHYELTVGHLRAARNALRTTSTDQANADGSEA